MLAPNRPTGRDPGHGCSSGRAARAFEHADQPLRQQRDVEAQRSVAAVALLLRCGQQIEQQRRQAAPLQGGGHGAVAAAEAAAAAAVHEHHQPPRPGPRRLV
ncbi:MAG: hypothetical protein ACKO25_11140 [Cyanobium sp.]